MSTKYKYYINIDQVCSTGVCGITIQLSLKLRR